MDPNQRSELLKSIKNVGYDEALLSENQLSTALDEGPKSVEYTKLVSFLANELREICNLDEHINTIATPEDSSTFIMETSSFLHELSCPYERLVQGPVSDRLNTPEDRHLLVRYLTSELMAARILRENQPGKRLDLKLKESEQASDLRKILQILGYPQPPKNITMQLLLKKLVPSIQNLIAKAPKDLIGSPIFSGTLSEEQWETLETVNRDLHDEYFIRREMLLKRLDCTIQSFQWSGKTKGKDGKFERDYGEKRKPLTPEPEIGIADLLAARDDVAIIEKTSNAAVRKHTKSSINRVIIGAVPDRGGRTSEQAPPPPEMPPWQQRNAGPMGGGGRGGAGNFSRGGGGSNFSQGGGFNSSNSRGGGAGNFSQGNYAGNRSSFDSAGSYGYSQGDNSRGGGVSSYSRGSYSNNRGSFDSAGSYGDTSRGSNYSGGFSRDNNGGLGGKSIDSYSRDSNSGYSRGGGYSQSGNSGYGRDSNSGYSRDSGYSQDNSGYSRDSNSGYSRDSGGYSQGGYSKGFDSAGSYGGQSYQEPKRAKTFDQFQQSKSTYADQYVQESQHNMQYQSRDRDNRGRGRGGRSNYNRGGGSYR
ncbi:hypothetical protein PPYR_14019 [Photinus pyralis]|uniref:Protein FAM98A n=1 Tax=Photinus pyralis TaxID=7054 RepID=A0A5N4A436_PHOPY|nr:protein FAM98B [Photinus pyralis]XP_031356819.1 protein FAM98B [Photinus pyralis]KAB0792058.1 hypothetical protein PPYR_14019 [Photinus pyralis]